MHQLRVAAVGKLVCENISVPINADYVVLAGLFHDMGNIIKSDIKYFPDFVEPEGIPYWQSVKDECIRKYGNDSHAATMIIVREIGLPESVLDIIDGIHFSHVEKIRSHGSWELKVCDYADLRVGPRGVTSMRDRIEEARKRYTQRGISDDLAQSSAEEFTNLLNACVEIEKQLESIGFVPPEATDEKIAPIIKEFWDYPIKQGTR